MKFKPEDFYISKILTQDWTEDGRSEWVADVANRKLEQWLSEAPIVYAANREEKTWYEMTKEERIEIDHANTFAEGTCWDFRGKVVCVEPIPIKNKEEY